MYQFSKLAMSSGVLSLLCAWTVEAGGFLSVAPTRSDVDTSLENELSVNAQSDKKARIEEFKETLLPFFTALPKNEAGNIEHQTARYILHRLFVHRHGWYIKGLEPNGDMFHASTSAESFKDWVPSYLVDHLEKRVGHKGLDLNDLAVLGASLEDLAQQEASGLMERVYGELLSNPGNATWTDAADRVKEADLVYLVSFLSGAIWDPAEAIRMKQEFIDEYTQWDRTADWYKDIEEEHFEAFGTPSDSADYSILARKVAVDLGASYGAFNDGQCTDLKALLMSSWSKSQTTGRIRLTDFYQLGRGSQWRFDEKKEYLRALGALDESNASAPMVIIPNYLTARPNCLDTTELYTVCCRNECEDLLGHLERTLGAPSAPPARIVELVSALGSQTKTAPRQLDPALVERLEQIAEHHAHGGEVKLHGRLFAQWMHHIYPNECPFPHEAGVADPSSPDEWIGAETKASQEEIQEAVDAESCTAEQAAAEWEVALPWSHTEELLHTGGAGATPVAEAAVASTASRSSEGTASIDWHSVSLCLLVGGIAVAALVVRSQPSLREQCSPWHLLMVIAVVIAVATHLVDLVLLMVMLCVGCVLRLAVAHDRAGGKQVEKKVEEFMC